MRIVLFHPTLLPPKDYGGVERVVLWLAKGLVELGHDVWVAALKGSRLPEGARLLAMDPGAVSALDVIPLLPSGVDIVHFMAPPESEVWGQLPCPGLVTVHGNGKSGEVFPRNSVFLSRDHARRHSAQVFVYNGIDPSEYCFDPSQKKDHFVFLSKTSWSVKNVQGAIRLCQRAEVPLQVAGGNRPLLPRLKCALSRRLHWVGPVAGEKKTKLLAEAKALVFPVLWPEPFGLVVVEALMSGTPVLANRRGSMVELLPGDVGAIFDHSEGEFEKQWIDTLRMPQTLWNPVRCREWALEHFHYCKMAKSYERNYFRLRGGETLHSESPVAAHWRKE